jgi:hypothetical protein
MSLELLQRGSIEQYENEERSLLAKRAISSSYRLNQLLKCMQLDHLSTTEKIKQLKGELFELTKDVNFKKSTNMGDILKSALDFIIRNYKTENPYIIN